MLRIANNFKNEAELLECFKPIKDGDDTSNNGLEKNEATISSDSLPPTFIKNNNQAMKLYLYFKAVIIKPETVIKNVGTFETFMVYTYTKKDDLLSKTRIQIPITISNKSSNAYGQDQSYVTSCFSHYIAYAADEVKLHVKNRLARWFILLFLKLIGFFAILCNIDHVVFVNNYLTSTNLYADDSGLSEECENVMLQIRKHEKKRAIIWRSLDGKGTPKLLHALSSNSNSQNNNNNKSPPAAVKIFSRLVNYLDAQDPNIWKKRSLLGDVRVFERAVGVSRGETKQLMRGEISIGELLNAHNNNTTGKSATIAPYKMHTIGLKDLEADPTIPSRMYELFKMLYLEKYSNKNPHYTPEYFENVIRNEVWTVCVVRLRSDNSIQGWICVWELEGGNVITDPALGYDVQSFNREDKDQISIYGLLQFWAICEAKARKKILNMSGGVATYKTARGAVTIPEYLIVNLDGSQVDWKQKYFYRVLGWLSSSIAVPLIERKARRKEI